MSMLSISFYDLARLAGREVDIRLKCAATGADYVTQ